MIKTTEEIQLSETTVSFRISVEDVVFAETLDECYQRKLDCAKDGDDGQELRQKPRPDGIILH